MPLNKWLGVLASGLLLAAPLAAAQQQQQSGQAPKPILKTTLEPAPMEPNIPLPDPTPGKSDDVPAPGSNTAYIHGPNEGAVAGAPPYRGGVPPTATQPNPTTSYPP